MGRAVPDPKARLERGEGRRVRLARAGMCTFAGCWLRQARAVRLQEGRQGLPVPRGLRAERGLVG
eukprot:3942105-Alexandrium_andersonii.AAC.1